MIHRYSRVGSTQDLLHQLAADGAPQGTAVVAEEQTAGRGSRGRSWHSAPGGLWLSVLLRPEAPVGIEVLSLRVGLALAATLDRLGRNLRVLIKWPNDLVLNDRKLGGVLCEARWQGPELSWVAVGVGINVTNPIPQAYRSTATRLGDHCPALTAAALVEPLVGAVSGVSPRGPILTREELTEFASRDWLAGRIVLEPSPGRADGVAPDGALLVRTADGGSVPARSGTVVLA